MQRLGRHQHHVVGDVDDVVDRALAGGHQPRLQPRRRRADLHALVHARGEARAQVGVLDDHLGGLHRSRRSRIGRPRRCGQRRARDRVDLPRQPVDTQAVGAVGGDLQLEDVGGDRQHLGQRLAGGQVAVEDEDARVVGPDAELVLGQDHPVGLDAAQPGLAERRAVGHHRAGSGDRDGLPRLHVRRAAHDLDKLARADVDHAHPQPVGVGVLFGLQHVPDDEVVDRTHAVVLHPADLGPREVEPVGELVRRQRRIDVVAHPVEGQPHPNCSSIRRSLS